MADVIFVTPSFDSKSVEEPIGTLLLSTILKQKGVSVEIASFYKFGNIDCFDEFITNAINLLVSSNPKIISFYTRCDVYHIYIRIIQRLKKVRPDIYIVFGGPQSDMSAEDTLKEIPEVDFICRGEGETTIYPFFSSLLEGNPDKSVKGLAYKENDTIIMNPLPELIENLSILPVIDYSLVNSETINSVSKTSMFSVDVGRGCPFACTYCSTKSFWQRKYRLKSPEKIAEEIIEIHKRFGITNFRFSHDMFTMNKKRVIETCKLLKKLDFEISWYCSARADCLDQELIDVMADAGMKRIFIGIETGSERMQKIIQKNLKLGPVLGLLKYIHNKGIQITASFIYGFPQENEDDISKTLSLIMKIQAIPNIEVQKHLCAFFPGTELVQQYGDKLEPADVSSNATGDFALVECADIIEEHPSLFPHFREYKTELRTKLKYLPIFCEMYYKMPLAYDYLIQKYEPNLINMYYDFVAANKDVLSTIENPDMYKQIMNNLWEKDKFLQSFSDDRCYEKMTELNRFLLNYRYHVIKEKGPITDLYAFNIDDYLENKPIQEYRDGFSMITLSLNKNGNIVIESKTAF